MSDEGRLRAQDRKQADELYQALQRRSALPDPDAPPPPTAGDVVRKVADKWRGEINEMLVDRRKRANDMWANTPRGKRPK